MSTKKINEALGINGVEEFLSDLQIDDQIKQFNEIDDQVKQNVNEIDNQIKKYQENGLELTNITDIGNSLGEIKQLINVSKDTIQHVYDSVTSTELVDAELVQALSKLLEATHLTVAEYINLYKDRLAFYDKIRLEEIKHQHDLEKIRYKHELDMKKLEAKSEPTIEVTNSASNAYSQEDIIKMLDAESN